MRQLLWLVLLAALAGIAYLAWQAYRKWDARRRAEEARFVEFMAQARPASPAAPAPAVAPASSLAQEKLLFEAAAKAADAGEPEISIQLYERLLARYPTSAFGAQAGAAIDAQRRRIGKGYSSA